MTMENEKNHDRSNVHYIKRLERPKPKRLVSGTRLVKGLLLIVAIRISRFQTSATMVSVEPQAAQ